MFFSGEGAELFATDQGFELVTQDYFDTERRWQALLAAKNGSSDFNFGLGTVGAVALDRDGNLAAGTSTGGLTNKPSGRIGDSPIIGAGTYANNDTVAVSAHRHGRVLHPAVRRARHLDARGLRGMRVQRAAQTRSTRSAISAATAA